jgi:hypothetical protein
MPVTINGTTGITTPTYNGNVAAEYLVPVTGFKNRLINGNMVIDQRNAGASVTPTDGQYTLDRWSYNSSQTSKATIAQSSTAPTGFNNSLLVTSSSAYSIASGDYFTIQQNIEGFNSADLAFGTANAKTVTLSFWVYSSLTGTFGGALNNSAFNRAYPFTYTISSANTWTQASVTIAGDTTGTWVGATNGIGLRVNFGLGVGATYSATAGAWTTGTKLSATGATSVVGTNGATFYITGVQFEVGTVATSFDFRDYGRELILCQRYFNIYKGGIYSGVQISSSTFSFPLSVPVSMRTQPSFSTNMTDSRFVVGSPNSNQWTLYIQNSGFNSYSGSIDTLSLNGPAANSTQYNIGTYGVTLNSFTGFLLGGNIFFSFSAEL